MALFVARGFGKAAQSYDTLGGNLDGDASVFESLVDDVFLLEREWYATLGQGTWRGLDLQITGRLRRAVTERGADGQRLDVREAEISLSLDDGGTGPGFYGSILAARGLSAMADPTDQDAEEFAEDYLLAIEGGLA